MILDRNRETITVIRAAVIVERGDEVLDWGNATEHDLPGCLVQPATGEELLAADAGVGRDGVVTRLRIHTPSSPDLTARDRVRVRGLVYEMDGPVRDWSSPTGFLAHGEANLRLVEG